MTESDSRCFLISSRELLLRMWKHWHKNWNIIYKTTISMSFWNIYKVSFLLSFILHDKVTVSDISVSLTQQALNIIKHQNYCEFSVTFPLATVQMMPWLVDLQSTCNIFWFFFEWTFNNLMVTCYCTVSLSTPSYNTTTTSDFSYFYSLCKCQYQYIKFWQNCIINIFWFK